MLCQIFGLPIFALGAMLLVVGGLSYKNISVFRVFGLNAQPLLVAVIWLAILLDQMLLLQISSGISGILLVVLSIQKWRMPLHFDIGDKTKFEV
ncbi:Uncharacterized integral membrane protein [Actinobacillus pleuropneumoniae]|nr:Uncharacterized integral membrane protein [Actinobacillus pleuropneumoniae]